MTGKEKCEYLKKLRKDIAEHFGIEYNPRECTHQGDCPGHCPVCDAEAASLMEELRTLSKSNPEVNSYLSKLATESVGLLGFGCGEDLEIMREGGIIEPMVGEVDPPEIEDDEEKDEKNPLLKNLAKHTLMGLIRPPKK